MPEDFEALSAKPQKSRDSWPARLNPGQGDQGYPYSGYEKHYQ